MKTITLTQFLAYESITVERDEERKRYKIAFQMDFDGWDRFEIIDKGSLQDSIEKASSDFEDLYLIHFEKRLGTQDKVRGIDIMKINENQRHLFSLKRLVEKAKNPEGVFAGYQVIME